MPDSHSVTFSLTVDVQADVHCNPCSAPTTGGGSGIPPATAPMHAPCTRTTPDTPRTLFPLGSGSDSLTGKALEFDHEVEYGARDPGDSTARHG
ncbi:hypothetical protein GCM10010442_15110 [Kitasatospora kifunensis]